MLVVSDASPINVLIRIGHIDTLPRLFKTVVITAEVALGVSNLYATGAGAKALGWLGEKFNVLKEDALAA